MLMSSITPTYADRHIRQGVYLSIPEFGEYSFLNQHEVPSSAQRFLSFKFIPVFFRCVLDCNPASGSVGQSTNGCPYDSFPRGARRRFTHHGVTCSAESSASARSYAEAN